MTGTTREEANLTPDQIVARADILFNQHRAMIEAMADGRGTFSSTLHTELMLALQEAWPHVRAPSPRASEPVAWRVKDFADSYFITQSRNEAENRAMDGHKVEPLYATPPSPSAGRDSVWEACAKVADDYHGDPPDGGCDNGATRDGWEMACKAIAKSIRRRDPKLPGPSDIPTDSNLQKMQIGPSAEREVDPQIQMNARLHASPSAPRPAVEREAMLSAEEIAIVGLKAEGLRDADIEQGKQYRRLWWLRALQSAEAIRAALSASATCKDHLQVQPATVMAKERSDE